MKKIKSLLLVVAMTFAATAVTHGQTFIQKLHMLEQTAVGTIKAADTTVNTDTTYFILDTVYNYDGLSSGGTTPGMVGSYGDLVIQWTNTQLSGTSGGSVLFQGSMTGTFATVGDWVTLVNDKNYALVKDTVTVSGTTTGTFIIPNNKFRSVRGRYISSGTQTSVITSTAWLRRH